MTEEEKKRLVIPSWWIEDKSKYGTTTVIIGYPRNAPMDNGLPKIGEYSAAYWREVAHEYGLKVPARARKAEVYRMVIARMAVHAALLQRKDV